jgi:hypothetical protein
MVFRIIKKVLKYLFWIGIIFSVIFSLIYLFGGKYVGALEAKYDLWKGHYELRYYGLQIYWVTQVRMKVLNTCGIAYRRAAGCMINDFIIDSVGGYNATMEAAIKENLGICVDCLLFMRAKNECNDKPNGPLMLMETDKPEDLEKNIYTIGDCSKSLNADVDGDKIKEKICVRYLKYKESDDIHKYVSLVVDLFRSKKQVLRQELNRGFFFDERFVELKDVNRDGKSELITKVRFGPDCVGCSSYRIYTYKEDRFELALNLFNIEPDNPFLKNVLAKLSDLEEIILKEYRKKTNTEHPCGIYEGCVRSDPWVLDSDHDGQPEVILLVRQPDDTDPFSAKTYSLFIAKFTKAGECTSYKFHMIDYECDSFACGVDILGFLETQDKHMHLLINYDYPCNSPTVPELNIFDIQTNYIKNIGKFDGFYEHAIVERLRDIDGDGNTEIVFVEDTYWPPGKSHVYIMPIYGIAEYREGRYVNAKEKFKKDVERLNGFNK